MGWESKTQRDREERKEREREQKKERVGAEEKEIIHGNMEIKKFRRFIYRN